MSQDTGQETESRKAWWNAIMPIWDTTLDSFESPETFLQHFAKVSPHIGNLLAVWWCDYEMDNGGFGQFFSNSSGVLAPEAAIGFRAIGLPHVAEIVETAMARIGSPYPRERDVRNAFLEGPDYRLVHNGGPGNFDELDDLFYDAIEQQHLSAATARYVKHNQL